MNKRPTISDVAQAAGVSLMSVSRAMNNRPGLSEETRKKILSIADQLGYRPSGVARALATKRSSTVGLMMPDVTNPFFSQIAKGAEDLAYAMGYNIFLVNTDEDIKREIKALHSLFEKQVDGVILCSPRLPFDQLKKHIEHFQFTALINRELNSPRSDCVTININDAYGSALAIKHFSNQGHKKIAFLTGPEESISRERRLKGFIQALETHSIPYDENLVLPCSPDTTGGYHAATALLSGRDDITAILSFNDLVAFGAIQACDELGKDIPNQVAVIGFDDIPLASIMKPKLSTLRTNKRELGHRAMQAFRAYTNGEENIIRQQTLEPTLILRESTLG
ncbi:MAG: LacI family DNA-binding transcriptional regulator [Anaerolineae bacterium]|jgi:LacI family transcriptional regulator|nr:LacI family DNA-binding transcriptional regulator [Anaerolineae bacterium]MBT7072862.1 LacI family DNA-binding transcriptional regulator [Anaerolineae bacterium]MBT7326307.1 LacI family DNA-binding transcriptional regulator [Anaerolineae bacterium]